MPRHSVLDLPDTSPRIGIRIQEGERERLHLAAKEAGESVGSLVRQAIAEYLARREVKAS